MGQKLEFNTKTAAQVLVWSLEFKRRPVGLNSGQPNARVTDQEAPMHSLTCT